MIEMTTKTVEIDGHEFKIKKPGILTLHRIMKGMPTLAQQGSGNGDPGTSDEIEGQIRTVCLCCVEPKFTDQDEIPEGCVSIEWLEPATFFKLAAEIMKFSGLKEATENIYPLSKEVESGPITST